MGLGFRVFPFVSFCHRLRCHCGSGIIAFHMRAMVLPSKEEVHFCIYVLIPTMCPMGIHVRNRDAHQVCLLCTPNFFGLFLLSWIFICLFIFFFWFSLIVYLLKSSIWSFIIFLVQFIPLSYFLFVQFFLSVYLRLTLLII